LSIFPKRTVPGKDITIHWCCSTEGLTDTRLSPYCRVHVRDPAGGNTVLFEDSILLLPAAQEPAGHFQNPAPSQGQSELPILVMLEGIRDAADRENAKSALQRLLAGRHYYFPFKVPPDAPLGRYALSAEIDIGGGTRESVTRDNDFFFVESLQCGAIDPTPGGVKATIENPSPHTVPAVVTQCSYRDDRLVTESTFIDFPPGQQTDIETRGEHCFLFYSEGREIIHLHDPDDPIILRNQGLRSLRDADRPDAPAILMPNNGDAAHELSGDRKKAWVLAARLTARTEMLAAVPAEVYRDMLDAGLLREWRPGGPVPTGGTTDE